MIFIQINFWIISNPQWYSYTRILRGIILENKYEIVKNGIKDAIISGEYQISDKLPTESELMQKFSVSRYTVRRAIGDLQNEHFVYRIQGGGMYVDDWQKQRNDQSNNKMIGIITTHIADYIFPNIISGIDRVVSNNGYSIIISNTHNNHDKERQSLIRMLDNDVDALIVEPTQSALENPNADIYERIKQSGLPLLFINATYRDLDFPSIGNEDKLAENQLIEKLFDKGHERILGIFQVDDMQGVHRMDGFVQAYQNHPDLSFESQILMYQSNDDMTKIFKKIVDILSEKDRPTAVACYNDQLAIQVIDVIKSLDLKVPNDVAVVGFDDYQLSKYIDPALTTVVHEKEKMGVDAGEMILKMLRGSEVQSISYQPELIIRDSI